MDIGDVSGMVEKIRDHRFDGYTDTGIADEIEKFRSGDGAGSIGVAVDALLAVAVVLAETDLTLRRELGKLGVEWQSEAGGQAGQVFTERAGFSQDATDKVGHSAEMIFAQGEAFSHTLYKLPDADTVRKGAGGLTLGDVMLSLIGFETDHVRDVAAAKNARAQAVEALNGYAKQSGENLSSVETLLPPEGLTLDSSGASPDVMNLAGAAVEPVPRTGDTGDTKAAQVDRPGVDGAGKDSGGKAHPPNRPHVVVPQDTPTSPVEVPAPVRGGPGPAPQPTVPCAGSTVPTTTVPAPPSGGSGGVIGGPPRNPVEQPEIGRHPAGGIPSSPIAPAAPGAPGFSPGDALDGATSGSIGSPGPEAAPGKAGPPGGVEGGTGARSGFAGGTGSATGGGEQSLGKGRTFGVGPQPPTAPGEVGKGFGPVPRSGPAAGDLGAAATALGAGGVGGAMSGERERQGRGFGRGAAGGRPAGQLPLGELPEEEATVVRNSERLNPGAEKAKAGFMERAAPERAQDEEDARHVRRFGIDDRDLFTDQRMVAPDLIGDEGADEAR